MRRRGYNPDTIKKLERHWEAAEAFDNPEDSLTEQELDALRGPIDEEELALQMSENYLPKDYDFNAWKLLAKEDQEPIEMPEFTPMDKDGNLLPPQPDMTPEEVQAERMAKAFQQSDSNAEIVGLLEQLVNRQDSPRLGEPQSEVSQQVSTESDMEAKKSAKINALRKINSEIIPEEQKPEKRSSTKTKATDKQYDIPEYLMTNEDYENRNAVASPLRQPADIIETGDVFDSEYLKNLTTEEVREIQKLLNQKGISRYLTGNPIGEDGKLGPETTRALQRYKTKEYTEELKKKGLDVSDATLRKPSPIDDLLVELDKDIPITVTSGYRNAEDNRAIGSSDTSAHRTAGRARDIRTKDLSPEQINDIIRRATEAGYYVIDERPTGSPHLHIEKSNIPERNGTAVEMRPATKGDKKYEFKRIML